MGASLFEDKGLEVKTDQAYKELLSAAIYAESFLLRLERDGVILCPTLLMMLKVRIDNARTELGG